jgi:hypothetical protein
MAEETHNAAMSGPIGIITAIGVSAILGWFLILSLLFSIQDYGTTVASPTGQPVTQIFLDTVGKKGAIVLIVDNVSREGWYERERRMGRRGRNENGWHGHYGLPASLPSDPSRAPDALHYRHVW